MFDILIRNALIVDGTGKAGYPGELAIADGKIAAIGEKVEGEAKQVVDAEGHVVCPGFIDAHDHLGMSEESIGFEGNDVNEMVDPTTPHVRAIDGFNPRDISLQEAREHGVTMVDTVWTI